MKVVTDSTIEPQITLDTRNNFFHLGEECAHDHWADHCAGQTTDECALAMTEAIMEYSFQAERQEAAEYTFGLVRTLLRKSHMPAALPIEVSRRSHP